MKRPGCGTIRSSVARELDCTGTHRPHLAERDAYNVVISVLRDGLWTLTARTAREPQESQLTGVSSERETAWLRHHQVECGAGAGLHWNAHTSSRAARCLHCSHLGPPRWSMDSDRQNGA